MKNLNLFFYIFLLSFVLGCGKGSNSDKDNKSDSVPQPNNQVKLENCRFNTEMFNNFAGIKFGATMEDVTKLFGKPVETKVEGEITSLHYMPVDGIPLIIWINTAINKVETIRLEVLGIGVNMDTDIKNAISNYKMDMCTASILGQSRKYIEDKFGRPYKAEIEDGNDVIDYYSADNNTQLTLKFWREQDMKCTQINVNWFYD